MHAAVGRPDDQRRLDPHPLAHRLWQIALAHHDGQANQRRLAFLEYDRAAANDGELGLASGVLDALLLLLRKHACEHPARREMCRGHTRVVADVASHFEAARDLLGVITVETGVERKVRWASKNEIETLVVS